MHTYREGVISRHGGQQAGQVVEMNRYRHPEGAKRPKDPPDDAVETSGDSSTTLVPRSAQNDVEKNKFIRYRSEEP